MKVQRGYFLNGDPCIDLHVCGVNHPPPGIKVPAVLDTGCSGFLHAPMTLAFQLGLPLSTTTMVELADGSKATCYVALAAVTFGGVTLGGTVVLSEQQSDVLVGRHFLSLFDVTIELNVNDQTMILRPNRRRRQSP